MSLTTSILTKAGRASRFLAMLVALTMIMALIPVVPALADIPADTIHITNSNISTMDFTQSGKYYVLDEDITLTAEWKPIDILGKANSRISITFDGQGHNINGLYVLSSSKVDFAGLFGHINRADVIIKNVGVNISSQGINAAGFETTTAGGLIGLCDEYSTVTIQNCYTSGNVSAATTHISAAGGLVGNISGKVTITNCYARGNVSASASLGTAIAGAGGLIGASDVNIPTITNCYATGNVYASAVKGFPYAGGLIGIDGYAGKKPIIISSYCLSTQSVIANAGVRNTTGAPLTPEEMRTNESFIEWDFNTIWCYKDGANDNYPILYVFYNNFTHPTTNEVTFTAIQTGGISGTADSIGIQITFAQAVTGLTDSDITISNGIGNAIKGGLSGAGTVYTVALDEVLTEGTITVSIGNFREYNIITIPQTVEIYKNTTIPETVTGVTVSPQVATITKGETQTFMVEVYGTNMPAQMVTWSIDSVDSSINADGVLTVGIYETAITITVTATSIIDITKSGTATVTVTDIVSVTSINVNPTTAKVNVGSTYPFNVTVTGSGNPSQDVIWSVEGSTVSTITLGGTLTVSANETATTLTVRAISTLDNTKFGTAVVTVNRDTSAFIPVTDITSVPSTATAGMPLNLTGTLVPSNATNQTIIWSVKGANSTGATITGNTFIASVSGTAIITATVIKGASSSVNFTKDFNITVSSTDTKTNMFSIYAETGGAIVLGTNRQCQAGEIINISANAYSDYVFDRWLSLQGGTFGNEYSTNTTFTMPSNAATVIAIFTYRGNTDWQTPSYTDAYITPVYTRYDKSSGTDVSVMLSLGGYTLRNLKLGNYILTKNIDYMENNNYYIFTAKFLSTLPLGEHAITFDMSGGINPALTVSIFSMAETALPSTGLVTKIHVLAQKPTPISVPKNISGSEMPKSNNKPQPDYPTLVVEVNGKRIDFKGQPPIIKDGSSLIPVREMFEMLNYTIEWNQELRTSTIKKGKTIITIKEGSFYYTVNGFTYPHYPYAPAEVINGQMMIPFVDVLKSIGCTAYRDENNVIHMFLSQ